MLTGVTSEFCIGLFSFTNSYQKLGCAGPKLAKPFSSPPGFEILTFDPLNAASLVCQTLICVTNNNNSTRHFLPPLANFLRTKLHSSKRRQKNGCTPYNKSLNTFFQSLIMYYCIHIFIWLRLYEPS